MCVMSKTNKLLKTSVINYYKITKRGKTHRKKGRTPDVNVLYHQQRLVSLGRRVQFKRGALRFEVSC